jgi:hypothetical protein
VAAVLVALSVVVARFVLQPVTQPEPDGSEPAPALELV